MTDIRFVKIRSWHALRADGRTRCGRVATGPTSENLPAGRSCESCLRIIGREADYG